MPEPQRSVNLPAYLTDGELDAIVDCAITEDLGSGDCTTEATVDPDSAGVARLIARESGILAGTVVADRVLQRIIVTPTFSADPSNGIITQWMSEDSHPVEAGETVALFKADLHVLLSGERVLLNFLQRMSGIATATARYVDILRGTHTRILDTRKTVPGLRKIDKWAVHLGGGNNHRIGLYDEYLIKENHITACGSLKTAIERVSDHSERHESRPVVLEVVSLEQIEEALATNRIDRLLLDNMVRLGPDGTVDTSLLTRAVKLVNNRVPTEASGNITIHTARAVAETGVDYISAGAVTHSVKALDLSLIIDPISGTR